MAVPFEYNSQSVPEEQEGCATGKLSEQGVPLCAFRITYCDRVMVVSRDIASLNPVGKVASNWMEHDNLLQHLELEIVDSSGILHKTITVRPSLTVQLSYGIFRTMVVDMLHKNNVALAEGNALLRFSRTFDHLFDIESLFRGTHMYIAPNPTYCKHYVGDLSESSVENIKSLKVNVPGLFEIMRDVLSSSSNVHRSNQHIKLAAAYDKMVAATAAVDIARSEALRGGLAKAYIDISFGKLLAEQTIAIRNYEQA